MVERLAESLDVPNADRNVLLLSAGYAPRYPTADTADVEFSAQERMLAQILSQQKSVPSLVIDDTWTIRMRNVVADRLFSEFRPHYRLPDRVANNALHIICHPDGLRQFMPNWTAYAEPFVRELDRKTLMEGSYAAGHLRNALFAYPGVADASDRSDTSLMPVPLTLCLKSEKTSLSFYTAFTTFDLPFSLKARSLKIESLYPADSSTARFVERLSSNPM